MKHVIVTMFLAISALPFTVKSQEKDGFDITGHVDGVVDGEKVQLFNYQIINNRLRSVNIDSCIVRNGEFYLKHVDETGGPHFYYLRFQWPKHKLDFGEVDKGAAMSCTLFIANGEHINIHGGNIDKFPERDILHYIGIDGSPSTLAYTALESAGADLSHNISYINNAIVNIRENTGYDQSVVGAYINSRDIIINKNMGNLLSRHPQFYWRAAIPYFMTDLAVQLNHASMIKVVYDSLTVSQKDSYYGRELKKYADLAIGQSFPLFTLPDTEGKPVALKDVLKNSKITLVHIWGPESAYRQKMQDELRIFYKKYHDKGLNVIGVSADTVAYIFKEFVNEQKYPWVNVSDLQGWDNHGKRKSIIEDVFLEGGHSYPNTTNILLDNTGKILAWDVYSVELQWYLEKYLSQSK